MYLRSGDRYLEVNTSSIENHQKNICRIQSNCGSVVDAMILSGRRFRMAMTPMKQQEYKKSVSPVSVTVSLHTKCYRNQSTLLDLITRHTDKMQLSIQFRTSLSSMNRTEQILWLSCEAYKFLIRYLNWPIISILAQIGQ